MRYSAGAYTDIGTAREKNQDSFCVLRAGSTVRGNVLMAVVCDGMGGLARGEVASGTVVTAFSDWFMNDLPVRIQECSLRQVGDIWTEMLYGLNERLKDYGRAGNVRVGTTFSGLFLMGKEYLWVHVGDSRIYLFREGKMNQLTSDHTVANRDRGRESTDARRGDMLTQCIGASRGLAPDRGIGRLKQMDRFLLCSDGFYHRCRPVDFWERMAEKMESGTDMTKICRDLSRLMMERGERDNVTAVLVGADEGRKYGSEIWHRKLGKFCHRKSFYVNQKLFRTYSKEILL